MYCRHQKIIAKKNDAKDRKMKHLIIVAGVIILGGCATPKPYLQESQYKSIAQLFTAVHKCVVNGHMSPETGALGKRYIAANLSNYQFDMQKFANEAQVMSSSGSVEPAQGDCNSIAMEIAGRKNQIDQQNQEAQQAAQAWQNYESNRPKQTYCNQIGTQTLCNTY